MSADTSRARSLDLLSWSRTYRIEAGGSLDFDAFPFQRELYEAFGDPGIRSVAVMKAAQCGISAAGVSLALYAADAWGANVLYVLPGFVDAHDFSDTRVAPTIRASAYLRSRVRSTDNKGLKQIGEAFVYFRGSGSEALAQSVPADVLILDEFDRLDRRQLPSLRRRLGAPTSLKLERAFSNPTYPESGIHDRFLRSDQRRGGGGRRGRTPVGAANVQHAIELRPSHNQKTIRLLRCRQGPFEKEFIFSLPETRLGTLKHPSDHARGMVRVESAACVKPCVTGDLGALAYLF